jgi:Short C-terminal domain
MGAAMIGGAAYVGHKAGQAQVENQMQEEQQNAQIQQLQAQQAHAASAAAAPAPAAPTADDMATKLTQLQTLKDQGVLSEQEFEAAKAKDISG